MVHIFKGKMIADALSEKLKDNILRNNLHPVVATILVGNNPASELYTKLKQKKAEQIGIEMDVYQYSENIKADELKRKINHLNIDDTVHGIMIQLPLPEKLSTHTSEIINQINPKKDVDGLRDDSPYIPATVKGIIKIIDSAKQISKISKDSLMAVIGAKGMVGAQLVKYFSESGYEVIGLDIDDGETYIKEQAKHADVLISSTGATNLITKDHIKKNAIVIDVGSPKGDVLFNEVSKKASFITPVPGGVGPMTIVSLMENVVEAAKINVELQ